MLEKSLIHTKKWMINYTISSTTNRWTKRIRKIDEIVIQILVYVGAVSVLIAFAVMLVKDVPKSNSANNLINWSIIPSTIFLVIIAFSVGAENSITKTSIDYEEPLSEIVVSNVSWIGELLIREYFISFQIAGLILLAALIGALALLRRER